MRKPFRNRSAVAIHDTHIGPNMTPMVDVVMVILIFFMASAALMGPEWLLRTALPSRKAAASAALQDIVPVLATLDSNPDGSILVRLTIGTGDQRKTQEFPIEEIESTLVALARTHGADKLAISLSPGASVSYEAVVRVHEACARAGVARVGVAPARDR
ncbi:MAG: biopolymer transporter ExbD [Planctomycetota bacterium]